MSEASLKSITVGNGPAERRIAVRLREGQAPGVVWLGGFKSDMQGTKAVALDEWAAATDVDDAVREQRGSRVASLRRLLAPSLEAEDPTLPSGHHR